METIDDELLNRSLAFINKSKEKGKPFHGEKGTTWEGGMRAAYDDL